LTSEWGGYGTWIWIWTYEQEESLLAQHDPLPEPEAVGAQHDEVPVPSVDLLPQHDD